MYNMQAQENQSPAFDHIAKYNDNFSWTYKDGKKGLIDKAGRVIIPNEFDEITDFRNRVAFVYNDGKKGLVNDEGKIILPCVYDEITSFRDGFAWTYKDGKKGKVSIDGKIIIPNEYDEIKPFKNDLLWTHKDGLKGLIDVMGRVVVPGKFDKLVDLKNGTFKAYEDGKELIIKYEENTNGSKSDSGSVKINEQGIRIESTEGKVIINKDSIFVTEKSGATSDTTKILFGKGKVLIISGKGNGETSNSEINFDGDFDFANEFPFRKRRFKGNWSGFEMGLNNYMNKNFAFDLPDNAKLLDLNTGLSWQFNINFMHKSFGIYKDRFGFLTGMGFALNNYRFDTKVTFLPDSSPIKFLNDSLSEFKKNKLFISYLTIPLLFEYQIPIDGARLHFSAGVIGSIKLWSRTKQIFENNEERIKSRDFHLSPFKLEGTFRAGYGAFTLFANYSLLQMFEKGKGPELYPITVGLGLMF